MDKEKDFSVIITVVIAIIICLVLWIGGMFLSHWYAKEFFEVSSDNNPQALFGDSFGAVNALISAFAFAGVIVAIVIQRNELKLQRQDLILQREEFSTQNETLKLQRFENTFFNMLSLQQQIVNELYYKDIAKEKVIEDAPNPSDGRIVKEVIVDKIIHGRELFHFSFKEIELSIPTLHNGNKEVLGMRGFLHFQGIENYSNCYTPSYFDHYFRHLYTIVKLVDKSDFLTHDEKYKYTTMIRATLSRHELVWLYYNGLSSVGVVKFKKLIERYSLLKNIREELLSLSKNNVDILRLKGVNHQQLIEYGFSGTDYEFWLTNDDDSNTKYHISAFYNRDDLHIGVEIVDKWENFIIKERN